MQVLGNRGTGKRDPWKQTYYETGLLKTGTGEKGHEKQKYWETGSLETYVLGNKVIEDMNTGRKGHGKHRYWET